MDHLFPGAFCRIDPLGLPLWLRIHCGVTLPTTRTYNYPVANPATFVVQVADNRLLLKVMTTNLCESNAVGDHDPQFAVNVCFWFDRQDMQLLVQMTNQLVAGGFTRL